MLLYSGHLLWLTSRKNPGWQHRPELSLLKGFILREEQLLAENSVLVAKHAHETQELHTTLAAVRLSHCSVNDHLASAENLLLELRQSQETLQHDYNQLGARYYLLTAELRSAQEELRETQEQSRDLHHENEANVSVAVRLRAELDSQSLELMAAESAARQMGDIIQGFVLTDDIAATAFKGAIDVADLMLHSKYQEAEIVDLKAILAERIDDMTVTRSALLSPSKTETLGTQLLNPSFPTNISIAELRGSESFVRFPDEVIKDPEIVDCNSACEMWEAYREKRPLEDDGLP